MTNRNYLLLPDFVNFFKVGTLSQNVCRRILFLLLQILKLCSPDLEVIKWMPETSERILLIYEILHSWEEALIYSFYILCWFVIGLPFKSDYRLYRFLFVVKVLAIEIYRLEWKQQTNCTCLSGEFIFE